MAGPRPSRWASRCPLAVPSPLAACSVGLLWAVPSAPPQNVAIP